jgi:hypothetical protein
MNLVGKGFVQSTLSTTTTTSSKAATTTTSTIQLSRRTFLAAPQNSKRRPSVTKPSRPDVEGIWYTPHSIRGGSGSSSNKSLDMGRYGLKRIDYHALKNHPPVWTLPPHPPTKSMSERVLFPLTLLLVGGLGVWAYLNPDDEDMKDYWKRVETGQVLVDDDDDDDDDDEWDDDDDDHDKA